jgi:phosphatidylinositol alpha-mannosyltransferase
LLNWILALWSRRTTERLAAVVTPSSASQAIAGKVFKIEARIIPVPVVLEPFRSAMPWSQDNQTLEILFLGRLVPRKGCLHLLKALRLLRQMKDVPSWHATVCGTGPLAPRLRQYVRDQGLNRRVTFTGFVNGQDKPRYFASAAITVLPSTGGESFGVVLVEAMASGRSAVLAGDNPGYRAMLEHCPGDVLFKPRNAHALAHKLHHLLTDQRERRHIAAWQGYFAEQFDINRVGREVLKTYALALRAKHSVR